MPGAVSVIVVIEHAEFRGLYIVFLFWMKVVDHHGDKDDNQKKPV
jgi:hypothetical protein